MAVTPEAFTARVTRLNSDEEKRANRAMRTGLVMHMTRGLLMQTSFAVLIAGALVGSKLAVESNLGARAYDTRIATLSQGDLTERSVAVLLRRDKAMEVAQGWISSIGAHLSKG